MLLLSRPRPVFKLHAYGIHLRDSKLHCGSTITVATFSARLPRYLCYIQGTLTTAIPVEVFCYLMYALDLIRQNSTWVMVCTQQPDFSAALSIQSMFPVNIAVAYLSEEKSIHESFVTDLRATVSKCDTVAPIQWERVCKDLAGGFPVDCTGRRYVDQEEEATQPEEEDGES